MQLLSKANAETLRFGIPTGTQRWRRLAALIASGLTACVLLSPLPPGRMHGLLLAGAGLLFVAGWLAALWDEALELDTAQGLYRYRRGFWPFRRTRTGPMTALSRLTWQTRERIDAQRAVERRYALRLAAPGRTLVLSAGREDAQAREAAYQLAARLDLPLEQEVVSRPALDRSPVMARVVIGTAWMGMLLVVVVMLWPVLSGSRPIRWPSRPDVRGPGSAFPFLSRGAFERGWAAYERGDFPTAESHFRTEIRDNPYSAEAYNMLAYALAEQGKLDAALGAAQEALKHAPDAGYILDTVAEMHERRGEYDRAADYYRRALVRTEIAVQAETRAKYGRTLLALGRRDEAIAQLKRAASFADSRWSRLARQLLRDLNVE